MYFKWDRIDNPFDKHSWVKYLPSTWLNDSKWDEIYVGDVVSCTVNMVRWMEYEYDSISKYEESELSKASVNILSEVQSIREEDSQFCIFRLSNLDNLVIIGNIYADSSLKDKCNTHKLPKWWAIDYRKTSR